MQDYEIAELPMNDSGMNCSLAGWYLFEGSADFEHLTWQDRGNGPEVTSDGVWGPFATESEAEAHRDGIERDVAALA